MERRGGGESAGEGKMGVSMQNSPSSAYQRKFIIQGKCLISTGKKGEGNISNKTIQKSRSFQIKQWTSY